MHRIVYVAIAAAVLVALPPSASADDHYEPQDPSFSAFPGATGYSGIEDPADGDDWAWQIEVPDDWNGGLVLYAHGFVPPTQAELVVQQPLLRPLLIQQGFAWAASSYSANGYVIDHSVDETHELLRIFRERTGSAPDTVLVHGSSMGGHVTAVYLERHPDDVDGALPVCGTVGGTATFEFYGDALVTAHATSGVPAAIPVPDDYLTRVAPLAIAELGLGTETTHAGYRWRAVLELRSGGERPSFEEAFSYWTGGATAQDGVPFLFALFGGGLTGGPDNRVFGFYDNTGTVYSYHASWASPAEERLNAQVVRWSGTDEPYFPTIAGTPQVPVLSLHTIGDLFVPLHNEQVYAAKVVANGLGGNLVQRVTRALGHCEFSARELGSAFLDLVDWVDRGVRPMGDDLLDQAAVADRDLGCAHSTGVVATRALVPPCGEEVEATRLAGQDRIATAVELAAGRGTAEVVLLARSDVAADSLAGAALAGQLDAPILLTPTGALDARVADAIGDLGATRVILLGGEAALSRTVASAVSALDGVERVERVAGADRFATAAAVATGVGGDAAFVVTGRDPADAIAVSALAAFLEQPVLLVEPSTVPSATEDALSGLDVERVTIIGGTAAVGASVERSLAAIADDVERLAGGTRYETSAAVVRRAVASGMEVGSARLATGEVFADALAAGPASADVGQVLALVRPATDPGGAVALLASEARTRTPVVVGGTAALPDDVVAAIEAALGGDPPRS